MGAVWAKTLGGTIELSAPGTPRLSSVTHAATAATGKLTTGAGSVIPLTGT